jgi:transposase
MEQDQGVGVDRRGRKRRSIAEKRRIVELTMVPGASVAQVAQANGVNANQVFKWRRLYEGGGLVEASSAGTALIPVVVSAPSSPAKQARDVAAEGQTSSTSSIHIELLGRALISVEGRADPALLHSILESLRR